MNNNQPISEINPFKSDVFTLGLIFLQISLLYNLDICYDYNKGTINKNLIE